MSTAVSMQSWFHSHEYRSQAAKEGWQRRRGLLVPEPWKLFRDVLKAADPRLVRLYCCDVAEGVQHHFQARYPGDTRTLDVIAVARRYANGEATEQERMASLKPVRPLLIEQDRSPYLKTAPADCALQAACFTVAKRLLWVAEWTLDWAMAADNPKRTRGVNFEQYAEIFAAFTRTAA